jgi:ribosome-binding protein aMBF1 (putative translation factor)
MSKCPVCDWKIEGQGISVKRGGREVIVCCKECAEKLAKEGKSKRSAKR